MEDMDSIEIRFTAGGSSVRTTDTSSLPAIIRCCCSTPRATAWRPSYGLATSTAPMAERNCFRDRPAAGAGQRSGLPRRRRLFQAGGLPGAGRTEREVRDPPSGERQSAAEHYGIVDAPDHRLVARQEPSLIRQPVGRRPAGCGVPLRGIVPCVGFIVTNLGGKSGGSTLLQQVWDRRAVDKARQAGVAMTRLSCHRFCASEVRL